MEAELYGAGIDYLTMTTHDRKLAIKTLEEYAQWSAHMQSLGYEEKPIKVLGYEGVQTANVMLAERQDGWLTRASGWQAGIWYRVVGNELWKPTRVDVQMTGVFNEDQPDFACEQAANAVAQREHGRGGRPYRVQLISGYGNGDTLSIGSRSSNRFGRLYDKHREAPEEYPIGAWRWELETKGEAAEEVNKLLAPAQDELPIVAGLILDYYTERGVQVPINVRAQTAVLHLGAAKSDDAKSLHWLQHYVKPTVDRLKAKGKEAGVRQALGLT